MADESYGFDHCHEKECCVDALFKKKASKDQHEVPDIGASSSCDLDINDHDTGYFSHDSSCPPEDSSDASWNPPCNLHKDSVQHSSPGAVLNWSCNEHNDDMHDVDEVEDLLYHFEKFFSEKLEHHVEDFSSSMLNMFSEQQMHVRQIVSSALNNTQYQGGGFQLENVEEMTEKDTDPQALLSEVAMKWNSSEWLNQDGKTREMLINNDVRAQFLIELLSLSCELSSLLCQDKFRSS